MRAPLMPFVALVAAAAIGVPRYKPEAQAKESASSCE
jgi:hypothetical protein